MLCVDDIAAVKSAALSRRNNSASLRPCRALNTEVPASQVLGKRSFGACAETTFFVSARLQPCRHCQKRKAVLAAGALRLHLSRKLVSSATNQRAAARFLSRWFTRAKFSALPSSLLPLNPGSDYEPGSRRAVSARCRDTSHWCLLPETVIRVETHLSDRKKRYHPSLPGTSRRIVPFDSCSLRCSSSCAAGC
jgi:hypothetical protein